MVTSKPSIKRKKWSKCNETLAALYLITSNGCTQNLLGVRDKSALSDQGPLILPSDLASGHLLPGPWSEQVYIGRKLP